MVAHELPTASKYSPGGVLPVSPNGGGMADTAGAGYFSVGATGGAVLAQGSSSGDDGLLRHQQQQSKRSGRKTCGMTTTRVIVLLVVVVLSIASLVGQVSGAATLVLGDKFFRRPGSVEKESAEMMASAQEEERQRADQQQQQQEEEEEEEEERRRGPLEAAGRELSWFPSVTNSTILFLHVFKCAGTSLREVLTTWAKRAGWSGVIVEYCKFKGLSSRGRICLNSENDLVDPLRQKWMVAGSKLLAGHFLWDFRHYVTPPYLMLTTLRNPLELFVSSQQFMHKDKTKTLEESVDFVSWSMKNRLRWADPRDLAFIRRFLDVETANRYKPGVIYPEEETRDMVVTAVEHLNTFFVVGVVEQYRGFIEVLKYALDPEIEHPQLWSAAVRVKDNGSPVHSGEVLRNIDPDLVKEFNATSLSLQWEVYEVALQLWDKRCHELLPPHVHRKLCTVPPRS